MKKCSICGVEKSDDNFYTPSSMRCKSCLNQRQSDKVYSRNLELYPDLEGELWKWVKGYEGLYRVSNYARIRSEVYGGRRGKILNKRKGSSGYSLTLVKNGEKKCCHVSKLVAEAFLVKPDPHSRIHHIDGNAFNDHLDNLRYITSEVNDNYLKIRTLPRVKHIYEELPEKKTLIPIVNSPEWFSLKDIEGEIWKDIEQFKGEYIVSNYGRVKSLARFINKHFVCEKILKCFNILGYWKVQIHGKQHAVHRLVAYAFIDNPKNLPFINHKDENRGNNIVTNLEFCDCKYNLNYGKCKEKMRRARLINPTFCQPTVCFRGSNFIVGIFKNQMDASRYTGVSNDSISRSCNHTDRFNTVKGYWFRKVEELREKLDFYKKYI